MSDVAPDIIGLLNTYSHIAKGNDTHMDIATWSLPEGMAADKSNLLVERMRHYRFQQKHVLGDGTRVIPTIETMKSIFDAYDIFELPVAISEASYTVYVDYEVFPKVSRPRRN